MKQRLSLFLRAGLHVALVSLNVWQIAECRWVSGAIVSFLISFNWTFNVRSVAFGGMLDRVVYATGALCGFLVGVVMGLYLYRGV